MTRPFGYGPVVDFRMPLVGQVDDSRGTNSMVLVIITEAALFLLLFFSYYYLARGDWRWLAEEPPKLVFVLPMLGVLLGSSVVLHWGEKQLGRGRRGKGQGALLATIVLGLVFLGIQAFEYRDHLQTLTPQSSAYGSIFYAITSFHAAHLIGGLLMLAYVAVLPRVEPARSSPHRPYHNAAMYWHFVDVVWVLIVGLLYVVPNLRV